MPAVCCIFNSKKFKRQTQQWLAIFCHIITDNKKTGSPEKVLFLTVFRVLWGLKGEKKKACDLFTDQKHLVETCPIQDQEEQKTKAAVSERNKS